MRRRVAGLVLAGAVAVLAACGNPVPPPPAPQHLTVAHAPADVVRIAAAALAAEGYEAVTADAYGGVLVARRERRGRAALEGQACRWPEGSEGARSLSLAHTITVTARSASEGGSTVVVGSRTLSRTALDTGTSETDCVSDGSVEARVLAALGVSP